MSARRIASALALALGMAAPLAAAVSPCATYISSRIGDEPVAGELLCWEEITLWWGHGFTRKYNTGYYRTDSGIIKVDCETYEQVA